MIKRILANIYDILTPPEAKYAPIRRTLRRPLKKYRRIRRFYYTRYNGY